MANIEPGWDHHPSMMSAPPERMPAPEDTAVGTNIPAGGGADDWPQRLLRALSALTSASWGALALLSSRNDLEGLWTHEPGGSLDRHQAAEVVRVVARQAAPVWLAQQAPLSSVTLPGGPLLGLTFAGPGNCLGALCLIRPGGSAGFTSAEAEAGLALCNGPGDREGLEEPRLRRQFRLLNQIAQAAAGGLDLQGLLRDALDGLDRELPLYPGAVWLIESPRETPSPNRDHLPGARLSGVLRRPRGKADQAGRLILAQLAPGAARTPLGLGDQVPAGQLPFARCLISAEPVYGELDGTGEAGPAGELLRLGSPAGRAYLAVPLRANDRTVGILHSVCDRPGGFPADFVQFVYLIADLLGPAVANCQMFGRLGAAYEALRETQGRLVHTEKMRALAEMAAGMAHEFNNSLCGTLGFIEVALRDSALPVAVRKHLEAARTGALDAAHTVRRVQSFARPHSAPLEKDQVNLDGLVQEGIDLIRHKSSSLDQARGGPIAIEVQAGARRHVLGNTTELREVLLNLAFNAVDAMPHGGTLTLRTWSEGRWVWLAVVDTGVGISEQARPRLFEPFFTTKGERGNGLGLSVVFGIVQRHGGEIRVESELGRGSTFAVRLPALAPESTTQPAFSSGPGTLPGAQPRPVPPRPASPGLNVLVVEDEEPVGRFLSIGLTSLGHRPRWATSATEALQVLADEGPFDLVLTDLGLPGMSGEELARIIAGRPTPLPVVLLTGWAGQIKAEGREPEGIVRVLSKPVTLSTLATTLRDVCPARRTGPGERVWAPGG